MIIVAIFQEAPPGIKVDNEKEEMLTSKINSLVEQVRKTLDNNCWS